MTAVRVARVRDEVRAGLRVGVLDAPLDSAVDQALREGLVLLTPHYPLYTLRFTVTEAALIDTTLLDLTAFAPDMQQLVALVWPLDGVKADYMTLDSGLRVLFTPDQAPAVGDEVEIVYRRTLTVVGLDGAATTTLAATWDAVWAKAAVCACIHGELVSVLANTERSQAIGEVRERGLLTAERRARAELDEILSAMHAPVRPVRWNRGL